MKTVEERVALEEPLWWGLCELWWRTKGVTIGYHPSRRRRLVMYGTWDIIVEDGICREVKLYW